MNNDLTFNDLPQAISIVLDKVSGLEQAISGIKEDLRKTKNPSMTLHQPLGVEETCEFLKMKKTTLYYYAQNDLIPVTKKGKRYLFFKDELIAWLESGRKKNITFSANEINDLLGKRTRRNNPK